MSKEKPDIIQEKDKTICKFEKTIYEVTSNLNINELLIKLRVNNYSR